MSHSSFKCLIRKMSKGMLKTDEQTILYNQDNMNDMLPDFKRTFKRMIDSHQIEHKQYVYKCITIYKVYKDHIYMIDITRHDNNFERVEERIELFSTDRQIYDLLPYRFGNQRVSRKKQVQQLIELYHL